MSGILAGAVGAVLVSVVGWALGRARRPTPVERPRYAAAANDNEIRIWLKVDGKSGMAIPSGMGWRRAAELLREWAEKIERDWPEPSETPPET